MPEAMPVGKLDLAQYEKRTIALRRYREMLKSFFGHFNGGCHEHNGQLIHNCPGTACCATLDKCNEKTLRRLLAVPCAGCW